MTKLALLLLPLAALLLQSCATQKPEPQNDTPIAVDTPPQQTSTEPKTVEKPFAIETLYALLVAEIAGSRERFDIALANYVQQAHRTRDPGIIARATRIARYLNARQTALDTAKLWVDIEPNNHEARFILASELTHSGQLLEALKHSEFLFQQNSSPLFQTIAARASRATDTQRERLLTAYQALHSEHPENTEIAVGLGLLYQQQGNLDTALALAQTALQVDPELIPAAILEANLLADQDRHNEAIERLSILITRYPNNKQLRLQYARLLASVDLELAQQQFEVLSRQSPENPELLFSLALIANERGDYDQAEAYFSKLTHFDSRRSSAYYYLGRLAERKQQWEQALRHYLEVGPGSDFLPALVQTTDILIRGGQSSSAHQRLSAARSKFPSQAEKFYLLEAEALSRYKYFTDAQAILNEGLEQFPNSIQLLYSRAMIHEKLDYITGLEQDLRTIIKYDPNNATALNALGYTLADRTKRYQEAYQLIAKALQIKPNDAAIIDSMGWVQYKLGNFEEAVLRLRQAMSAYPDHEVAAHLGEVLWVIGEHEEAHSAWQQGLELNPSSEIIPATMNRLQATGQK